nr:hypothetical protein PTVJELPE_PTVJELPE_CDS_0006 [Cressdnaviricota sp.]
MVKLSSRGHEIVSSTPFEPGVRLGQPPRESLADKIRRMLYHQQMDAEDTIKDEADMMEDLNDFSDDEADQNLLGPSSYEVADDVPDAFSASAYRESKKKKDSPNAGSSGEPEPSSVAGE